MTNLEKPLELTVIRDLSVVAINYSLKGQDYKVDYNNYVTLIEYVNKMNINGVIGAGLLSLVEKFVSILMSDIDTEKNSSLISKLAQGTLNTYFDDSIDNLSMIYGYVGDEYVERYRKSNS